MSHVAELTYCTRIVTNLLPPDRKQGVPIRDGDAWVNNAVMSGEASDLRLAGTERSVVAAQYEDPSNLQSRVNVYAYLYPEQPLPKGVTFEDWFWIISNGPARSRHSTSAVVQEAFSHRYPCGPDA